MFSMFLLLAKYLVLIAVLGIVAIALFAFTFASCKKDYTCECTILGITTSDTQKLSKKDADTWCGDSNTAAQILGGSCSLK